MQHTTLARRVQSANVARHARRDSVRAHLLRVRSARSGARQHARRSGSRRRCCRARARVDGGALAARAHRCATAPARSVSARRRDARCSRPRGCPRSCSCVCRCSRASQRLELTLRPNAAMARARHARARRRGRGSACSGASCYRHLRRSRTFWRAATLSAVPFTAGACPAAVVARARRRPARARDGDRVVVPARVVVRSRARLDLAGRHLARCRCREQSSCSSTTMRPSKPSRSRGSRSRIAAPWLFFLLRPRELRTMGPRTKN